jgi:voltage-gated sodium channel
VGVIAIARRIAENPRFQHFILVVIIVGAIVIGVETSATLTARYSAVIFALEMLIQTIFVVEIAIRILAYWPRPAGFFANGWNVFDFSVVAASLLPQAGAFAMVARLARLLRVTRVVSAFPELRLIIGTMVRSIPLHGPRHRAVGPAPLRLCRARLSFLPRDGRGALGLARRGAADALSDADARRLGGDQKAVLGAHPWAWLYFSSFVLVAVFVVVNLFIAVVINNLESVKHEQQIEADHGSAQHELLEAIETVRQRLAELEDRLRTTPPQRS